MARRRTRKLVRNVCTICGKSFMSARKASVCVDNSTCRVKKHHADKKAAAITKSLTLDMSTFAQYAALIDKRPTLDESLKLFLVNHGFPAYKDLVAILTAMYEGKI